MGSLTSANDFENNLCYTLSQLPGLIAWKKVDLTFRFLNKYASQLIGYNNPEETIGITDYDIKCEAQNFADIFRQIDRQVLLTKQPQKSLDIVRYTHNQLIIALCEKRILTHPSQEVLGVLVQIIPLNSMVINTIATLLLKNTPSPVNNKPDLGIYPIQEKISINNIMLSPREADCLFYLIRGKTAKEIGSILNISSRTVESHLSKLRIKFHCYNKSQLIELAIENGYLNVIPSNLLNKTLVDALKS